MLKKDPLSEKRWQQISSDQDAHFATFRRISDTFSEDEYYESARRDVAAWLDRCGHRVGGRNHALDIGTGLGRYAFALREHFAQVTATDLTPRYREAVDERAKRLGITGIHTVAYDGPWSTPDAYDMVLAINLFSHIENAEHLRSYFDNIASSLHPQGIGILHIDTRTPNLKYRVRQFIPGRFLPPQWRKGFRRIWRDYDEVKRMIEAGGLAIVDEINPRGEYSHFVVTKR